MAGSIGTLYGSLEALGNDYMQDGNSKVCLLKPRPAAGSSSDIPLLTIKPAAANKFYCCSSHYTYHPVYVSDGPGAICPQCNVQMSKAMTYVAPPSSAAKMIGESNVGGYVKGVVTYMTMDDLWVQPMSTISSITLLNKFNVQDVSRLEEKEVTLDMNLGMSILKASLISKTVLTDVFLPRRFN